MTTISDRKAGESSPCNELNCARTYRRQIEAPILPGLRRLQTRKEEACLLVNGFIDVGSHKYLSPGVQRIGSAVFLFTLLAIGIAIAASLVP